MGMTCSKHMRKMNTKFCSGNLKGRIIREA